MKRCIAIVLMVILASGVAGQDLTGTYQYGAGACYSPFFVLQVNDGGYSSYNYSKGIKGFDLFAFYRFHQNTLINITSELKYSWKRFGFTGFDGGLGGGSDYDLDYSLGYLDITILPLFTIGNEKRFYLGPGFCVGALVNTHATGTIESWMMGGSDTTQYIDGPRSNGFSKFTSRLCFRLEFELPVSEKYQLQVVNRYEYTLSQPHFFTISLGIGAGKIFRGKGEE